MFSRIDVVVEAVFDSGSYSELHPRIQFLKGFGQKVGGVMPESMFAFGVIPFEKFYLCIASDRALYVPFRSVDFSSQYVGGEAGAYAFGNLAGGGSLFILPLVSVRKSYSYHPVIQLFVVAQLFRSVFIGNSGAQ